MKLFKKKNARQGLIRTLFQLLGLQLNDEKIKKIDQSFPGFETEADLTQALLLSKDALDLLAPRVFNLHLYLIHQARLKMIRTLLPSANQILDLGGPYAPLHKMGYPHQFEKLTLVDLPTDTRHEEFQREVPMDDARVFLRYEDMTKLAGIASNTIDLVWSGQSIEHISIIQAKEMCTEIYRVLKPGGNFCLDTPNGLISRLHAATAGLQFVHPDHKIEYTPNQLQDLIKESGFIIQESWGICEMPMSAKHGAFNYDDFLNGGAITANINAAYIQYVHAKKPVSVIG